MSRSKASENNLLIALVALAAIIIVVFLFQQGTRPAVDSTPASTVVVVTTVPAATLKPSSFTISGLEVAKKTSGFFEGMSSPDAPYYVFRSCSEEGSGKVLETYAQGGAWMALGYVGLYDATGEERYLDLAFSEMKKVVDETADDFDLLWVLVQASEVEKRRSDALLRNFSVYSCDTLDFHFPPSLTNNAMMAGIQAREFAICEKYLVADPNGFPGVARGRFLKSAKRDLAVAENISFTSDSVIFEGDGRKFSSGSCWVQLAKLELYGLLGDEGYLSEVKDYFDSTGVGKTLSSQEGIYYGMVEVQPCVEALVKVYRESNEKKYLDEALLLQGLLLNEAWDYGEAGKCGGDGGFLSYPESSISKSSGWETKKSLTDAAYAVYLFSLPELKDVVFEVDVT